MGLNRLVLIINASYEPIRVAPARRAIALVFKGAATVEEASEHKIRTPKIDIAVPSVIRLFRHRRVPWQLRAVSRRGVLLRDGSVCQYCGRKPAPEELTLDHVIPRSRAGPATWENLVACCLVCNGRKGNRTPQEAGMTLLRQPRALGTHTKHRLLAGVAHDRAWEKYLFY
jgi:5-methylcytosine-specific restriction endonuclease McrA